METEEPTWQTWSYLELRTLRRMEHTSTQRVEFSKLGNAGKLNNSIEPCASVFSVFLLRYLLQSGCNPTWHGP